MRATRIRSKQHRSRSTCQSLQPNEHHHLQPTCRHNLGPEPEGQALPLGQTTPHAVPMAGCDRIAGTLANHRAAGTEGLGPRLSDFPRRAALTVGRKEAGAVSLAASGPQPPRPERPHPGSTEGSRRTAALRQNAQLRPARSGTTWGNAGRHSGETVLTRTEEVRGSNPPTSTPTDQQLRASSVPRRGRSRRPRHRLGPPWATAGSPG